MESLVKQANKRLVTQMIPLCSYHTNVLLNSLQIYTSLFIYFSIYFKLDTGSCLQRNLTHIRHSVDDEHNV